MGQLSVWRNEKNPQVGNSYSQEEMLNINGPFNNLDKVQCLETKDLNRSTYLGFPSDITL